MVDVADDDDNMPCVSNTDAVAGKVSGQQGILIDNIGRDELGKMQRDDNYIGIIIQHLEKANLLRDLTGAVLTIRAPKLVLYG